MAENETTKSADWHAGFAAARHQAACEMGHFIDDEGGSVELAEAAYDHLKVMEWNPDCEEQP